MKPRFKLSTDGRVTLVRAGLSGLNEQQTRQFIVSHYGTVARYCSRVGMSYEAVHRALHPGRTSKRVDATTATRIVLGLPLPGVKKAGFHTISGYTKSVYATLADGHAARQYPEATAVALSKEFGLAGAVVSPVLHISGGRSFAATAPTVPEPDTPKTRVLTKDQVIANFLANGQTFTAFAAANRFELSLVYAVLHGRVEGLRGQSHNIAVALGLKDGRRTDKPVRKSSRHAASVCQGAAA